MKYIIDPYFFSFSEDMSKKEFDQYLNTIKELNKWWKNHRNEFYVLSETGNMLYEYGMYPLIKKMAPLLEKYDSDLDYKDVNRVLNRYLDQTNFIDNVCGELFIEKIKEEINTDIKDDMNSRPEMFRSAFHDLMWYVFCLHLIENKEMASYVVFSKTMDKSISLRYNYECIDTDVDSEKIVECCAPATINCHSSIDAFQRHSTTPFVMWKYSSCKSDLDFGLRCMVMQDGHYDSIEDIEKTCHFIVQDSFYEDFCNNHYDSKDACINSALESIFKVIKDIRHGKEHNMRTGRGGNDPYLFHEDNTGRDFSGMRKNVTTSIKLHYWKRTPFYKFAKIGEHDCFDLPWEDN